MERGSIRCASKLLLVQIAAMFRRTNWNPALYFLYHFSEESQIGGEIPLSGLQSNKDNALVYVLFIYCAMPLLKKAAEKEQKTPIKSQNRILGVHGIAGHDDRL